MAKATRVIAATIQLMTHNPCHPPENRIRNGDKTTIEAMPIGM